jgi:hypothetical protein
MDRRFLGLSALNLALALGLAATATASDTAFFTMPGNAGDQQGAAVADVGDIDKDGVNDFLIGSPLAMHARLISGRDRHVIQDFYGSSRFGVAVAGAGDVNNDGWPDLIIGAENNIHVHSGKDFSILYYKSEDGIGFGLSVAGVGDTNKDGFADFAVGAPFADVNGKDSGFVRLYSGKTGDWFYQWSEPAGSQCGFAVAAAGDLNLDGYPDVLFSCPEYTPFPNWKVGDVVACSGKNGQVLANITGTHPDADFGFSIAGGRDIDSDGYPDVLVGAPFDDRNGTVTGCLTVVSGKWFNVLHEIKGTVFGGLGWAVSFAGDLNADAYPDIAASAPYEFTSGFGAVHVFTAAPGQEFEVLYGNRPFNTTFGKAIAGVRDVNGDGRDELLVGDPGYDELSAQQGVAYLFSGKAYDASWSNYGTGWPGTNGIPSFTASDDPVLCSQITLMLGNSLGASTNGVLLLGLSAAQIPTTMGGTLLVAPPWTVVPVVIPQAGMSLPVEIFCEPMVAGISVYLQGLVTDAGASQGFAFSPGLKLTLGGS